MQVDRKAKSLAGFARATSWEVFNPGRTYVIGNDRYCNGDGCRGFRQVTCAGHTQASAPVPVASGMVKLGTLVVRRAPSKPGCYQHMHGAADWQEVPCLSREELAKVPLPDYGPVLQELPPPATQVQPQNVWAQFDIVRFGSVSDNQFHIGKYSLQINSQQFIGNNGHKDWVQLTFQSTLSFGKLWNGVCIRQWDLTVVPHDPSKTGRCWTITLSRGPQAGDQAQLSGYLSNGNIEFYISLPWAAGGSGPIVELPSGTLFADMFSIVLR